jgi:hypothetical protein
MHDYQNYDKDNDGDIGGDDDDNVQYETDEK